MKIKIEIKNKITGKVLFEFESEKNTIKKTLVKAVSKGAYLGGADLGGAYLGGADLRGADLGGADLGGVYLGGADLGGAYLGGADLGGADLGGADLGGVYLGGADLGDNIDEFKHLFWITPEEGSFIAWKRLTNGLIAKLEIPAKAKRTSNIKDRKCRASYIKTLKIWDGKKEVKEGVGQHDGKTIYKVGRLTKADSFNPDIRQNCTNGIHFFMTKQEALNW